MWGNKAKLLNTKSLLTTPSNGLPLHLKQTFPPINWIFTEGEGDGIKSRLPFFYFTKFNKDIIYSVFCECSTWNFKNNVHPQNTIWVFWKWIDLNRKHFQKYCPKFDKMAQGLFTKQHNFFWGCWFYFCILSLET